MKEMEREETYTETVKCICGKSSVVFESDCEEVDLYLVELNNIKKKRGKCYHEYFCKSCGEKVTQADKAMVVYV